MGQRKGLERDGWGVSPQASSLQKEPKPLHRGGIPFLSFAWYTLSLLIAARGVTGQIKTQ